MTNVTIRNLDTKVVKRLKARAKTNNRSFEAELRDTLTRSALRPSTAELLAEADRIAAMTPKGVKQTDSVVLLREDRER